MSGRGSTPMSRSETMRFARGLYDTGKNKVASRTRVVPVAGAAAMKECSITVDGAVVASGPTWPLCYSNMRFRYDEQHKESGQ